MISKKDIQSINRDYFNIIEANSFYMVLQSKNTGHFWYILESVAAGHRTFRIQHKHHSRDPFHPQTSARSLPDAYRYIYGHDAFHCERKKLKEAQRRRNCH